MISDCLRSVNADVTATLAAAESAETKEALRRATGEASRRGVFGAPSFLIGDELFWGNDRLDAALDWYATRVA